VPRHVDHEQRRRDIVDATLQVLAKQGTRGMSFRSVAQEMGGSTTLVTHYFPTQKDLLNEVTSQALAAWDIETQEIDAQTEDPLDRLVLLLHWLVPITELGMMQELSRIHLLAGQLLGDENRAMFEAWDSRIRSYLRTHLTGLVPDEEVEQNVELLRVVTSGIVLSVVEHPHLWSAERQVAVIDNVLQLLGLEVPASAR